MIRGQDRDELVNAAGPEGNATRDDAEAKDRIATGRVSWFNLDKQFGFVKLEDRLGDAFLHMSVLKAGGYYFVPRGTTVDVRVEPDREKYRVVEVLRVDTSTAQHGESPPLPRTRAS